MSSPLEHLKVFTIGGIQEPALPGLERFFRNGDARVASDDSLTVLNLPGYRSNWFHRCVTVTRGKGFSCSAFYSPHGLPHLQGGARLVTRMYTFTKVLLQIAWLHFDQLNLNQKGLRCNPLWKASFCKEWCGSWQKIRPDPTTLWSH